MRRPSRLDDLCLVDLGPYFAFLRSLFSDIDRKAIDRTGHPRSHIVNQLTELVTRKELRSTVLRCACGCTKTAEAGISRSPFTARGNGPRQPRPHLLHPSRLLHSSPPTYVFSPTASISLLHSSLPLPPPPPPPSSPPSIASSYFLAALDIHRPSRHLLHFNLLHLHILCLDRRRCLGLRGLNISNFITASPWLSSLASSRSSLPPILRPSSNTISAVISISSASMISSAALESGRSYLLPMKSAALSHSPPLPHSPHDWSDVVSRDA